MKFAKQFSLLGLVPLLLLLPVAWASSGDRLPEYRDCVSSCTSSTSSPSAPSCSPHSFPLSLQLTRWTCLSNCQYLCTHSLTNLHLKSPPPSRIHQYYGKWPFWRFMGMQEPASVLFSLMNMMAHLRGGRYLMKKISRGHPMRRYYKVWTLVNVNAWLWSSVFHTRDVPLTEKLDYFSAALAIVYSVFMAVVRLFHLYNPAPSNQASLTKPAQSLASSRMRKVILFVWAHICIITFLAHVSYLTLLPRFDYSYNMAFNIAVAGIYSLLWVLYSLPIPLVKRFSYAPRSHRPKFAWKPGAIVLMTICAMSFELLDFPPWNRILDAHALWHLSTVPIVLMWYNFYVDDSLDEGWRLGRV